MAIALLPLRRIIPDPRAQPRAEVNPFVIAKYANKMESGEVFPPIVVFFDGEKYYLGSGFHRFYAVDELAKAKARRGKARRGEALAGPPVIAADVRPGTLRDAILFSVGENADHGWPRTEDDERRAVRRMLEDETWRKWSNNDIARRCKVGDDLVAAVRAELYPPAPGERQVRTYRSRHGTIATMDVTDIGRSKRPAGVREPEGPQPDIALDTTLRSVVTAMKAVPSAEQAAARMRTFPADAAEGIARWWTDFAEELRELKESAA